MIYKVYTETNYNNVSAQTLLKQIWKANCKDVFGFLSIKCYKTIPKAIEHAGYNKIIKLNNENVFDLINDISYVDKTLLGDLEIGKRTLNNTIKEEWDTSLDAIVVGFDDKLYKKQGVLYTPDSECNLDEIYIKSNARACEVIKFRIKDFNIASEDEQAVDVQILERASIKDKNCDKSFWFSTVACTL